MTVCIAAIYNNDSIIGASDRLLTAGDVLFQPNTPKIKTLTSSIVAMTAGDAWLQSEILSFTAENVSDAIKADRRWLPVRYVVDSYCHHWAEIKKRRAEQSILRPLGLTTDRFLAAQATMHPTSVQDISNALISFAMPTSQCLIAGIDDTGPHVYVIYDGTPMQADTVGFAAIGSGARHAESQLMLAQYSASATVAASLALVHLAKTRAEVAPGVGAETDMFIIGPQPGTYMALGDEIIGYLDNQATRMSEEERKALISAELGMREYISSFSKTPEPQETDAEADGRGASAPTEPPPPAAPS
jgi:20S proteasome alpha/beta subunit